MSVRTQRLEGQIQKEIADMLLRGEIHDPRLGGGLISVTGVKVSGDMLVATVYVTAYGRDAAQGLEGLGHASGYIRSTLGKRLKVRRVPELRFREDTSLAYGHRIEALLHSIKIQPETGE